MGNSKEIESFFSEAFFLAAHCLQYKNDLEALSPEDLIVLIGRHNLESSVERGAIQRDVKEIHIHPDWDPISEKWDADLTLLVLKKPVKFSEWIQPVCISADKNVENYEEGTVVKFILWKNKLIFIKLWYLGWLGKNRIQ